MATAQERKKRKLLQELQQMPIVQIACKRVGIPRSTYYRWRQEDAAFATQANEALSQGVDVVNDVAESKVISGVNNGDQRYVFYWLNNRHLAYKGNGFNWLRDLQAERYEDTRRKLREFYNERDNPKES